MCVVKCDIMRHGFLIFIVRAYVRKWQIFRPKLMAIAFVITQSNTQSSKQKAAELRRHNDM